MESTDSSGAPKLSLVSEDARSAMGFASEYLASRYLRAKHKDRYDERCWVAVANGHQVDAAPFDAAAQIRLSRH